MADPGFDFIKLTKAQWRHLLVKQRDHGIPWHHYIKVLIQQDMDGVNNNRQYPMADKASITPELVTKLVDKIEEMLSRPVQQIPVYLPKGSGQFSDVLKGGVVESNLVKPSKLKSTSVLADGTNIKGASFRNEFMDELHQALGLEPLNKGSNKKIQISDSFKPIITDAPEPPK